MKKGKPFSSFKKNIENPRFVTSVYHNRVKKDRVNKPRHMNTVTTYSLFDFTHTDPIMSTGSLFGMGIGREERYRFRWGRRQERKVQRIQSCRLPWDLCYLRTQSLGSSSLLGLRWRTGRPGASCVAGGPSSSGSGVVGDVAGVTSPAHLPGKTCKTDDVFDRWSCDCIEL